QSNAELRAGVDKIIDGVVGFLWVLIGLVFVVASLGIVNTLTMNVHEQTRELGVLRAIGMRRGQVWKMVVSQAITLGLLSVLLGLIGGNLIAFLMNVATWPFAGHEVAFTLHPVFITGCAAAAQSIAILASLLPARRA